MSYVIIICDRKRAASRSFFSSTSNIAVSFKGQFNKEKIEIRKSGMTAYATYYEINTFSIKIK